MKLLNDDLLRLVSEGVVDAKEAHKKCIEKGDMAIKLKVAGFKFD